ncbi:hypothetical protein HJC23_004061 [Cyclotella cryptica]|uniref:Peptidase M12B domain-containing protein n=1 Tax=Cyclotella cryptica TaxID=29204 RepID=A0ABD3QUR5_9STRA
MLRIPAISVFVCLSGFSRARSAHHRRRLSPNMSIINELNEQLASGIEHPRFTLTADLKSGDDNFASAEQVEVDVVLTNPSVSQSTSFSVDGGASKFVQTTSKFFVADQAADETLSKHFALVFVDEDEGLVSGLVQKDGKLLKLEQRQGRATFMTEVHYDPPRDWECTVALETPDLVAMDPADPYGRRLAKEHENEHRHPQHNHAHHGHHHTVNLKDFHKGDIFSDLRNINPHLLRSRRRLYATDTFPNKWSYQVDLYIEIDGDLVSNHDPNDAVNMPNTIAYVNALITAASSVYEQEVDTHLHVLHIAKTTLYDSETSTAGALDVMYNQYSSSSWHYVDPVTGESPDLHHAILYRSLGGGIAYLGAVCNSYLGYGVSGGVEGSISDLGGGMFWDMMVIMHEIGHNFGAKHTHDISGFNPKVDACGDGQCTSLVNGQYVSSGDGTVMSYCHQCSGGVSNIGFTFGGYWNGDDRSNVNNWISNAGVVPFSQEPKRVPKVMYEHVSSRGTCVDPYLDVPPQICSQDSHCHDGNSCTTDSCDVVTGMCSNIMRDNCCGNFVCEAGESAGSCSDCGPFTLLTPSCSSCWVPHGVMFDVEATTDIILTSLTFRVISGTNSFNVYSAPGGYSTIATNQNAWTLIASNSVNVADWTFVQVEFTDIPLPAGSKRTFYIATSAQLAASDDTSNPLSSDDNLKLLNPAGILPSTEFQYLYSGTYSW